MKTIILLSTILVWGVTIPLHAQTLYVDAIKGNDNGKGSLSDPVASLEKAVDMAKAFNHHEAITIKVFPGLYNLTRQLKIEPTGQYDTAKYSFEAMIMPDDTAWKPAKMPVIQSGLANNIHTFFDHSVGFEILRDNISIKGLKFLGNANPMVDYYYPIERDSTQLKNLEVSQCYFIGDRNSATMQVGVYAQGAGIHVDHCIFYGCKFGILLIYNLRDFSLTNSILYGVYGTAVWYGTANEPDAPFIFSDNVVANCTYFWANTKAGDHPSYHFSNSLITGNLHYMAKFDDKGLSPFEGNDKHTETGVRRSGTVLLNEVTIKGIPRNYLHLAPSSDGKDIHAGIFKNE